MQCPNCLHSNAPAARFCNQCGERLEAACSGCGTANPPASRYCQQCGQALGQPSGPQSYTPRHLAEQVLRNRSAIEGERKQVTVLFADVAGFTGIAEGIDPEETHTIMDRCFNLLLDEIHRFGGTVNQFTGDGVMALFGAPLAHEDHARLAINAAVGIQAALGGYARALREERGIDFRMRIGINSGLVVVGRIGDDLRTDYTAIGDTTNLAARMLALAEPGKIVVSEQAYRLAQSYFSFTPLGEVVVKGRREPARAYELKGLGSVRTKMEAALARGLSPFVGRERELDLLMDAFARAQGGSGQVVTIAGEAGVGKSRLVYECLHRIEGQGALVFEGACAPYSRSFPYFPFVKIVRDYCEVGEEDNEARIREKARRK